MGDRLAEIKVEEAIEQEQTRWQNAIDELVVKVCPDRDGSGCESGDPLDFTLAELQQAFDSLGAEVERLTERLAEAGDTRRTQIQALADARADAKTLRERLAESKREGDELSGLAAAEIETLKARLDRILTGGEGTGRLYDNALVDKMEQNNRELRATVERLTAERDSKPLQVTAHQVKLLEDRIKELKRRLAAAPSPEKVQEAIGNIREVEDDLREHGDWEPNDRRADRLAAALAALTEQEQADAKDNWRDRSDLA